MGATVVATMASYLVLRRRSRRRISDPVLV
jgi:hypothetical protein